MRGPRAASGLLAAWLSACSSAPKLASVSPPPSPPAAVWFQSVRVFDGRRSLGLRDVVVRGGKVESVSEPGAGRAPEGAVKVDGAGKSLLPGLVDIHVHLMSAGSPYWKVDFPDPAANANAMLYSGVTACLAANGTPMEAKLARRARTGEALAPRLFVASEAIGAPGGHPSRLTRALVPWPVGWLASKLLPTASTPEEARETVRTIRYKRGPSFLKLVLDELPPGAPKLSSETFRAAVRQAKELGMRPIAHIGAAADMVEAAEAGVELLMHPPYHDELTDEQIRLVKDARVPFVTTSRVFSGFESSLAGDLTPLERETAGPAMLARFSERPKGWKLGGYEDFEERMPGFDRTLRSNIRRLLAAGVPVFAGTDTGLAGLFPGAALHSELSSLAGLGLSPEGALRAATGDPGAFLGPCYGRIEPGCPADLLLVRGDPASRLEDLSRIEAVYFGGAPLERRPAPGTAAPDGLR